MEELTNFFVSNPYMVPGLYAFGGLLLGAVVHQFIISRLRKLSEKTAWAWDDIVIKSLGRVTIIWFFIGGTYLAILETPLMESYRQTIWQVLLILFIGSISLVLSRMAVGFIKAYSDKTQGAMPATSIFTMLTRVIIYTLAVLVILQTFGVSITPFLTALGVGGLAVALALQETLGNLFAGIHLIASKKFKPGDYIELEGGNSGFIEDISWRNTTIRTMANNLVILPNQKIASATITNYSRPQKDMSVLVDVGVSYGSDLERVEKIVIEVGQDVMDKVTGGVEGFVPLVRFHTFGDSGINFTVVLRVQEFVNQYLVKHEFVKALRERFKKEDIEIPFPQRDVHLKKE